MALRSGAVDAMYSTADLGSGVTSLAFQSTGSLLAAVTEEGQVLVFDAQQFSSQSAQQPGQAEPPSITSVASARLAKGGPCKGFVAWQLNDTLTVAYQSGEC